MKLRSVLLSFFFFIMLTNCSNPAIEQDNLKIKEKKKLEALNELTALPTSIPSPVDNPITPEKVKLGRLLFFDPILSGNKDVACATCHHPKNGYAEFRDLSIGVNGKGFGSKRHFKEPNDIPFVKRNAHTILNTAFNGIKVTQPYQATEAPMFWDNRSNGLEAQALEPLKALEEMRGRDYTEEEILPEIVQRLSAIPEYQRLFAKTFKEKKSITELNIGKAIAAFERTLVTNHTRFDQYMRGDDTAISLSEKEGFALFKKVGCANCHNGPMFSDYKIHVLGVPANDKLLEPDNGFEATYGFRTPTLRNLRFTAPYMHNGSLKSLQRVLEFYEDISDGKIRNPAVPKEKYDPLVRKLNLRVKDMAPIISFLNTLNDNSFDKTNPEKVPSGLPVGGHIY